MAAQIQKEEAEQKKENARVTIPCYGCTHMCASPVSCVHPNGISVRWDPIRNKPYRLPSLELCHVEGGLCNFYEPDEDRGADYKVAQKKKLRSAKRKASEEFDDSVNKLSNGESTLDDFIDEITQVTKEVDDLLDKGVEDNGKT